MKIEGYFSGIKNANTAVEKLKTAGYLKSVSDLNEHYSMRNNTFPSLGGNNNAPSLSNIVLNSGNSLEDINNGPLLAASPMVSGMGSFEEVADINYKVTVEAEDKEVDTIKEIISNMGGILDNPNFELPEGIDNIPTNNMINKLDLHREKRKLLKTSLNMNNVFELL